jgi:hypothetical protein
VAAPHFARTDAFQVPTRHGTRAAMTHDQCVDSFGPPASALRLPVSCMQRRTGCPEKPILPPPRGSCMKYRTSRPQLVQYCSLTTVKRTRTHSGRVRLLPEVPRGSRYGSAPAGQGQQRLRAATGRTEDVRVATTLRLPRLSPRSACSPVFWPTAPPRECGGCQGMRQHGAYEHHYCSPVP